MKQMICPIAAFGNVRGPGPSGDAQAAAAYCINVCNHRGKHTKTEKCGQHNDGCPECIPVEVDL